MTDKNYKQIAREILDSNELEPMQIHVAPKHLDRIQQAAEAMDLTISEAATFMLYAFVNDVEALAMIEHSKRTN